MQNTHLIEEHSWKINMNYEHTPSSTGIFNIIETKNEIALIVVEPLY